MLGKIQEISTRLDKKRVYTAVGALVVALATGHVMQRNVTQPNVVVDMPSQQTQASMVPMPVSTPAAPVLDDPATIETAALPDEPIATGVETAEQTASIPEDVLQAAPMLEDVAPPTEARVEVASVELSTEQQTPLAPTNEAVTDLPEQAPEMRLASLEMVEMPSDFRVNLPATEPNEPTQVSTPASTAGDEPFQSADVTRAATDQSIAPESDESLPDIDPPAPDQPMSVESASKTASCKVDLRLTTAPGAMVRALILAPCSANEEVEFDHAGLRFTESLDDKGALNIAFPAMTTKVALTANLSGTVYEGEATVPDMAEYDRVALVWKGGTGLQLHALENGAFYGEAGHVWAETPGTPDLARNGNGGFLTVLGSTSGGYAADIYTYPVAMPSEPAISIEAQVLENTCEKAVVGEYLRSSVADQPKVTDVGMVVPDCGAVGEYLVLKNLPRELTIARN